MANSSAWHSAKKSSNVKANSATGDFMRGKLMELATWVAWVFAALWFCTYAAYGQATSAIAGQHPAPSARHQISCTMTVSPNLGIAASGPAAPYSAVQESFTIQTLADGKHISRKPTSEKIYRDSQGKTNQNGAALLPRNG